MYYKGTKIQLLDLPGIIEGAAHGKGRGRQVIAVAKSADLVLMVLDAGKEGVSRHKQILEGELESVGLRLNKRPANIYFKKKATGGIKFTMGGKAAAGSAYTTISLTSRLCAPAQCR